MALSGIQTYQLAFNEKVKKVEVLSGFTEIRQHIESAFDGNEKEKYALIDTIEKAEKSATVVANRNITLSIVTFCVALAGAVLAERNIAKKKYTASNEQG